MNKPPPPGEVIVTQPITPIVLGPGQAVVTCPTCHAQVTTKVELENSTKTHLFALLLCLIFFPCVCLPYCMDSRKSRNHYCPKCKSYIGRFEN